MPLKRRVLAVLAVACCLLSVGAALGRLRLDSAIATASVGHGLPDESGTSWRPGIRRESGTGLAWRIGRYDLSAGISCAGFPTLEIKDNAVAWSPLGVSPGLAF